MIYLFETREYHPEILLYYNIVTFSSVYNGYLD